MTGAGPPWAGRAPAPRGATARALWNLRALGLFLLGPALSLGLAAAVFGVPDGLLALAATMFLLSLALFGVLLRGERRRLRRAGGVRAP